ncbi:MAG: DsbA family protein, partial [Alphaproteobacteria bacterium]
MTKAVWYFDFISPFAYLQWQKFDRLPDNLQISHRPVLFAGLLNHWGQKGPAEIPAKRRHTYRYCRWLAQRRNIPFTLPPAHPFNPLKALRLAVALGEDSVAIGEIFRVIYAEGVDVADAEGWRRLTAELGVTDT